MDIFQATRSYEAWLGSHVRLLKADLALKHQRMAEDAFCFLRATFYRWMQLFPEVCAECFRSPSVLAVGDLHVENYGTWRDTEGRLIWGINDFDEAFPLPCTVDLVRLATSALLAIKLDHLTASPTEACDSILEGYLTGLERSGQPFVLSEEHPWLRDAVTSKLRDPTAFWQKLSGLPTASDVPARIVSLLRKALPEKDLPFRVVHRLAGLGSLGRERYTALVNWRGGKMAREIKPLLPSACTWAGLHPKDTQIFYTEIVRKSVRTLDPFLVLHEAWIQRRLSPSCSRLELTALARARDEEKLLWAMGLELANIHLGTRAAAPRILRDLGRRKRKWLRQAAEQMAAVTLREWKDWRKRPR